MTTKCSQLKLLNELIFIIFLSSCTVASSEKCTFSCAQCSGVEFSCEVEVEDPIIIVPPALKVPPGINS